MSLNIKIHNFEGPFDLLLHLIKKNEMDIYNISIYEITDQYLQYLRSMRDLDLEITSEFIVIAATLIEIKSKTLLPKAKNDESAADLEGNDPRKELVQKLLEYKKYKAVSVYFKEKMEENGVTFSKKPEIIVENKKENKLEDILKNVTILKLYYVYNDLMNKYKNRMNDNINIDKGIAIDRYKIEDKMIFIQDRIRTSKNTSFSRIVSGCESKIEVIVSFLALLELIKLKAAKVTQDSSFSEIYIEGADINEEH
ncbi:segregation/condensation protein A [Clostridium sp. JN-9]|uniref:segregation/condensation protein A n=1 Tax=Clostridium sp. JN-9 TaxID=2507159 RepID=UPI000FFE0DDB|nr:segregation/condensation protein A [Clostridium sp. JN-9]QAT40075.1 segregation/condensation protein A [Clostridium sp. JN-9]